MAKIKEFTVLKRFYSSEDGLFHIIKRDDSLVRKPIIDETHVSFDEFYHAVNCDLSGIDLLKYNFDGIDLEKYNFENAIISSKIMQRLGIYDDRLYKKIHRAADWEIEEPQELELIKSRELAPFYDLSNDDGFILYISDLHLCYKLEQKDSMTNEYEIRDYAKTVVKRLRSTLPQNGYEKIIIIGDVAAEFDVFKIFFEEYAKVFCDTIFVLGNHELWYMDCNSIDSIVEQYREFLSSLGIVLLENELYFPRGEKRIWSANEIITATKEELREVWRYNGYAIFGGLGYAGLNDHFNYDLGIYRDAPLNRDLEIEKSKLVESLHEKLRDIASDKKLFFVTHNPKEDWTQKSYVKNWVYFSGHTHHNYYCEDDEKTVYADNQIGNKNESFGFKYVIESNSYDIFCDYANGIYEISREEYHMFNRGIKNYLMRFNRPFEKLFMLKNNGYYMFLIKLTSDAPLKLLNGGAILNIPTHSLEYYYNNLENYANSIKAFLQEYNHYQNCVSKAIKAIGGDGTVHGSIVDIDYNNHIYVNIIDGKLTPYYATSIIDKTVYPSLQELLADKCPSLCEKYNTLLEKQGKSLVVLDNAAYCKKKKLVKDTQMYKYSRKVKTLQYTSSYNVVRFWNDSLVLDGTKEIGGCIVGEILDKE